MAEKLKKTDAVIIGLGAGGGMAALGLTRHGIDVIGLEAGPIRTIADFPSDEVRHDVRNWMGEPKFNHEIPTTRSTSSETAGPAVAPIRMINGVGGTSIHYGMQTWRYLPWNFKMRSETLKHYGSGMIPAGSLVEDWPFSYEDLEPYYDKVEYEIGASGKAGNINGHINDVGNPFEGPRSRDYPLPPLRYSGYTKLSSDAARNLGWHPFQGPAAIHSEEYRGNPGCMYCGFCQSNGCHTNAKGSTFLNAIPDAEKTGHLKVVPNTRVVEITTGPDGRVTGVEYLKGGRKYHQPASVVVLATYVFENTRLLLLSKSKAYPNGLSNNHGQVGKGYISHLYASGTAVFPGKRMNIYGGPTAQFTAVDDWDSDNFDHSKLDFIGGASFFAAMEGKPIGTARTRPPSLKRGWGSEWKSWMQKNAISVAGTFAQVECLAYEENYLDLDPTTKDPLGFPVVRITWEPKAQDKARLAFIESKLDRWMKEMGAAETWTAPFVTVVNSHAYGGTRMGTDVEASVVDPYLMSHEAPNLAVLGGSTFPSSTGRNPTETIEATAWRAADHIAENWGRIAV
jgi:gluconate 2-dehydrogenase alpha chain